MLFQYYLHSQEVYCIRIRLSMHTELARVTRPDSVARFLGGRLPFDVTRARVALSKQGVSEAGLSVGPYNKIAFLLVDNLYTTGMVQYRLICESHAVVRRTEATNIAPQSVTCPGEACCHGVVDLDNFKQVSICNSCEAYIDKTMFRQINLYRVAMEV